MASFKLVLVCLSLMLAVCAAKTKKSIKATRMVGGDPVSVKSVPFIVSIKNVPLDYHKCAGFLVSNKHLVTTATCLYPINKGEVQAFVYPETLDNLNNGYKIVDWVIHYNYTVLPREHDIAVATLEKPVAEMTTLQFPKLSKWAALPAASVVTTYGWGYTKLGEERYGNFTLHSKDLNIMSNARCSLIRHEYLPCSVLCASSDTKFATTASDIGTPLIHMVGVQKFVVGLVTTPTEKLVSASTFLSLYQYRDFIEDIIHGTSSTDSKPTVTTEATPETTPTTLIPDDNEEDESDSESEDDEVPAHRRRKNHRHHG